MGIPATPAHPRSNGRPGPLGPLAAAHSDRSSRLCWRVRRGHHQVCGAVVGIPGSGSSVGVGCMHPPWRQHARLGASRYRAGVLGTVVPRALPPWAGCVSRPLPRPPGRGGIWQPGWYPRAWRWSVAGRPGPAPRSPAPQHGAGGDGPQRTFCGRRGSVPCGPRLSLGVRRQGRRRKNRRKPC